jgi:polar amino acid transport system substrate-binding protein
MKKVRKHAMKPWLLVVGALALASCASAPMVSPESAKELAPLGKLRAAINYGNPVLATRNPATGELRGVTVELSRELGRRVGVPVELVGYDTVAKLVAGLKTGEWDVAFLAVDPARAGEVAFTAPYMEVEVTYLVPERSDILSVLQVDRPEVRVAVQERNAADLFLTRELKHASLVRAPNESGAFGILKTGAAEAYASNLQILLSVVDTNPGYRAVNGRFTAIQHAVGVLSSRSAAAAYLRGFIEDVKASGFVRRAIDESGIRGVVVAPPGRGAS